MNLKKIFSLTALCLLPATGSFAEQDYSKDLLLAYFPESIVNETLPRFKVPKEEWEGINKALQSKDNEVIRMVEEKASKITPNPLLDPEQRQVAAKLFRETLFEIFADVMNTHGVNDNDQIQEMLNNIQQLKADRFAQCMQNKKIQQVEAEVVAVDDSLTKLES